MRSKKFRCPQCCGAEAALFGRSRSRSEGAAPAPAQAQAQAQAQAPAPAPALGKIVLIKLPFFFHFSLP